jgi:hypothetical protein
MKGDVQSSLAAICVTSEAFDYGMNSGFYLIQFQKVGFVVHQLFDGFVHVSQRCVLLLLFEGLCHTGFPALGQLFERAYIHIAVVEKRFELGHVLHQETAVLSNRIATHRRHTFAHIGRQESNQLGLSVGFGRG